MSGSPSLTTLRAFEAVARHGSLTRAARELFVTPAAVSHRIAEMERRLGTPLFKRVGKSYQLTEAGEAGFRVIGDAFERLSLAVETMRRREQRQSINLSAPTSLAVRWILPRLRRFEERFRNVAIFLEASDDPMQPREYFPDVIVAHAMEKPDARPWQPMLTGHHVVVAAPSLLRAFGPVTRAADLLAAPLIHSDWRENQRQGGPSWSQWFQAMGVEARHLPRGLHVNQGQLVMALAAAGRGFAVTNVAMAESSILAGELQIVFADPVLRSTPYWLLAEPERAGDRPLSLFRDWLLAEAEATARLAAP